MIDDIEKRMPVAVWIERFEDAEQAIFWNGYICNRRALIRAASLDQTLLQGYPTNPLSREYLEKCERLARHGFTVIEVPEYWSNEYSRPHGWVGALIDQALDRVPQRQDEFGKEQTTAMYDEVLANAVLKILALKYPHTVNMLDIKTALKDNEPSDDELLTALQALQLEGLITGDAIPEHTSGKRKLAVMMKIRITKEGKQHVSGEPSRTKAHPVVHQYNNYGQSGAMGPSSVGTINYQSQWQTLQGQVDLTALAAELGSAIEQQSQTAKSSADYQELALLAQAKEHAEKHEGGKLIETLSNIGQTVLPVLARAGAEGLIHWIEHKTGTKLS